MSSHDGIDAVIEAAACVPTWSAMTPSSPACPTDHPKTKDARSSTNPPPTAASTPRSHPPDQRRSAPTPPRARSTAPPAQPAAHSSANRTQPNPARTNSHINKPHRGDRRDPGHTQVNRYRQSATRGACSEPPGSSASMRIRRTRLSTPGVVYSPRAFDERQ